MSKNTKEPALAFDPASDAEDKEAYRQQLNQALLSLENLPDSTEPVDRARLNLDVAEAKVGLGEMREAWDIAKNSFHEFIKNEDWQDAVEACDVLYQTGEADAIVALGHGAWLGITYPVKARVSVTVLNHIVDETPTDSDGRAVAATVSHYLASIRTTEKEFESLGFFTQNVLASVAEKHSQITSQEHLNFWMERLELNDPEKFLPRMATIIDVIVDGKWWIDRDALRSQLP